MELDDQFYQNIFRLVATDLKNTEANEELFHIFQQVKQHYVENGITELWRPIISGTAGGSVSDFLEVPPSSKRQSIAAVRRESLLSDADSSALVIQSKSPAHSSAIDSTKNPPSLIYDSSGSGTIFSLKSELLSTDDHHSLSTNDFDDLQDSSSVEPLRLVANFEENDESVNVVVEQSSTKLPKVESDNKDVDPKAAISDIPLDVGTVVDVSSSPTLVDEHYLNAQSLKIRRLAHGRRCDSPSIVKVKNLEKVKTLVKQEISEESIVQNPCATCKSTTFTLGNSLVECHQCHTFYHQKCHTPNVPQSHINDPRSLWYCSVCSKKMKKTIATVTNAKDNAKKPCTSSNIRVKNEDPEKEKQHRQFLEAAAKRVEHKQNPLKKPVATLAADFLAKHKGRTGITSASKAGALTAHSPPILSSSFGSNANAGATVVKTPSGESAATGLIGLGKLAVVQQPRSSTTTQPASSTSMSSSGAIRAAVKTIPGSSSNVGGSEVAAQKKLQMMKKKAAEKKNLIK